MKIKQIRKWITALRSGNYKQTTQVLVGESGDKDNLAYCCIGVAAKLQGLTFTEIDTGPISKELGLSFRIRSKLVDLNDNKRLDFLEIADWIEKNINEVRTH